MHISTAQGLARLAQSDTLFIEVFKHGTLVAEVYKPTHVDLQTPHTRDEIYVIISGSGDFFLEGNVCRFQAGDFLFVPAFKEHRFLNFTEDFSTWVFFYGAEGGEADEQKEH
jgi:mannose-6-phosphate isomerase-like protein (cupin superfamily)